MQNNKKIVENTIEESSRFKQIILSFLLILSGGIFFTLFIVALTTLTNSPQKANNISSLFIFFGTGFANLFFFSWLRRRINEFGGRFIFTVVSLLIAVPFLFVLVQGVITESQTAGERVFGWMIAVAIFLILALVWAMAVLSDRRTDRLFTRKLFLWGAVSVAPVFMIAGVGLIFSGTDVPWRVINVGTLSGLIFGLLAALIVDLQMWRQLIKQGFVIPKSDNEKEIVSGSIMKQMYARQTGRYEWIRNLIIFGVDLLSWFLLSEQERKTHFDEFGMFTMFTFIGAFLLGIFLFGSPFLFFRDKIDAYVRRKTLFK